MPSFSVGETSAGKIRPANNDFRGRFGGPFFWGPLGQR